MDAAAGILKALIPTLDNLDRALGAPEGEGLRQGVELIRRDLLALLEAQGVVRQDPKGEPFDPERHQALSHEAVPGHEEGTIVEVFGAGYTYKDRLLRAALVKVAKGDDGGDSGGDPGAVH
jgi:molecular chaperone GrpE